MLVAVLAAADARAQSPAQTPPPGGDATQAAEALYNGQDLRFLQHMIVHHEQALAMSDLVPERTQRQPFVRFARYIERGQASEIAQMRALLDVAAARGRQLPEPHLDADPPMPGMLSSAEMRRLAAATGEEFERLWIEGMIFHHQGAIDMAQAQQLQQLESGRRPYGLHVLVEDIIVEQRAEIAKMRAWLDEWGIGSGSSGR
ncbi:MAG: DUF305 domain-containing protein [Gammaproteobacteria bacterium]|nr:DUF305 domain-containing protein [Gammaproteobacteria bacterium]